VVGPQLLVRVTYEGDLIRMQALSNAREWLGEFGPTELRLLESGVVVLLLMGLRALLLVIARRNVKDARAHFAWDRGVTYGSSFIGILLVGRIWFEAFGSLATFLGLIGAGIALALKDPVTNLAGWIFIVWRRPFRVGDRVQLGALAGDVIDIRVFQFILLEIGNWVDADQSTGRLLHVPNGKVFTEPTANYTEGFPFIWNEIAVPITFESNWRAAKEMLLEVTLRHVGAFAEHTERDFLKAARRYLIFYSTLKPTVYTSVRPNGVVLTIRHVCAPRQRRAMNGAIWEDILDSFAERSDIEFAYPTTRFFEHEREGKPELRASETAARSDDGLR
jgi:small-conductance mechanosensitive channel